MASFRLLFQCIELIQNMYQIDFLFSLETKRIDQIFFLDGRWYNMYWVHLGVKQVQMKILIGPLSFLTLEPLLLSLIFDCYVWLLGFSIDFLNTLYIAFNICILLIVFQRFDELAFSLYRRLFCSFQDQCCSYINKPTIYRCCHQEVFRQIRV